MKDLREYSLDSLAFLGDAIYSLLVKEYCLQTYASKAHFLHKKSTYWIQASTQAKLAKKLVALLPEEEKAYLLRGRNSHPGTMAKNSTSTDYRWATGLEVWFAYLYFKDKESLPTRLNETSLLGRSVKDAFSLCLKLEKEDEENEKKEKL